VAVASAHWSQPPRLLDSTWRVPHPRPSRPRESGAATPASAAGRYGRYDRFVFFATSASANHARFHFSWANSADWSAWCGDFGSLDCE
jgi:hypothetical protein